MSEVKLPKSRRETPHLLSEYLKTIAQLVIDFRSSTRKASIETDSLTDYVENTGVDLLETLEDTAGVLATEDIVAEDLTAGGTTFDDSLGDT